MVPRWRVPQENKKKVCLAVLMMGEHVFIYIYNKKKSSLFCPRNDAPASCGQIRGATGYKLLNL